MTNVNESPVATGNAKAAVSYNFVSRASMTKQFPTWEEAYAFANDIIKGKQKDEYVQQVSISYSAPQYRYDRTTGERTDDIIRPALWSASVALSMGEENKDDMYW